MDAANAVADGDQGQGALIRGVMKNWLPPVSGPESAMPMVPAW